MSDVNMRVEHHKEIINGVSRVSTICIEKYAWCTAVVTNNGVNKYIYCCPGCISPFDTTDEVKQHMAKYFVDGRCAVGLKHEPMDGVVEEEFYDQSDSEEDEDDKSDISLFDFSDDDVAVDNYDQPPQIIDPPPQIIDHPPQIMDQPDDIRRNPRRYG
ncbi:uncharacterized protein LOC126834818 [Adelges cooleyi]|uniref:uncharacterized protein LOC126834818 n=1 Tax=Adelges cooleyi TaxID=133065 RepID=UPI00218009A8|nr:uncharacterized protein LOC126834818 [Adelges cooleyi]